MFIKPIAYASVIVIFGSILLLIGISCNSDSVIGNRGNGNMVTDVDGNLYQTVKIGNQVWTAENLRTTKYNDGTPITNLTTNTAWDSCIYTKTGAYCYYNNTSNPDSIKKFGALYNWFVVSTEKLAPAGWHVPSDEEWDTLLNYLIENGHNWDSSTNENKIAKSMASKVDWESSDIDGAVGNDLTKNDLSGFSALPGGARDHDYGGFHGLDSINCWWSSMNGGATGTWYRRLSFEYEDLLRLFAGKNRGFSVRLIRNSN